MINFSWIAEGILGRILGKILWKILRNISGQLFGNYLKVDLGRIPLLFFAGGLEKFHGKIIGTVPGGVLAKIPTGISGIISKGIIRITWEEFLSKCIKEATKCSGEFLKDSLKSCWKIAGVSPSRTFQKSWSIPQKLLKQFSIWFLEEFLYELLDKSLNTFLLKL